MMISVVLREPLRPATAILLGVFLTCSTIAVLPSSAHAQSASIQIGVLKYGGGGDWYQGQTPLPNLIRYVRQHTLIDLAPQPEVVELTSDKIFSIPFLFMSGHGNVVFSDGEASRLRRYLEGGGFLYIDDDYGLDEYVRRELKKVFSEGELVELPFNHDLYHIHFDFDQLPKIHEHDGARPQAFGIFVEDRLVLLYTFETDLGDGWENPEVHNDPPDVRLKALQMGANIIKYVFEN